MRYLFLAGLFAWLSGATTANAMDRSEARVLFSVIDQMLANEDSVHYIGLDKRRGTGEDSTLAVAEGRVPPWDLYWNCGGLGSRVGLDPWIDPIDATVKKTHYYIDGFVFFYDLHRAARELGFADAIGTELAELESAIIAANGFDDGATERFVKQVGPPLARWAASPAADHLTPYLRKQLTSIVYAGGCGAGEVEVKLETEPQNARVYTIKRFYHLLCNAKGQDPWSMDECFGWQEAATTVLSLAGDYNYIAVWADGHATRGSFSVTSDLLWSNDGGSLTLRLAAF